MMLVSKEQVLLHILVRSVCNQSDQWVWADVDQLILYCSLLNTSEFPFRGFGPKIHDP